MPFCSQTKSAGVVYVEFIIAAVPLLIMLFCLMQLALILSAGILVTYSAQKAARAAIVVLGDDHEKVEYSEPLHQVGNGGSDVSAYRGAGDNSRYEAIRIAARYALAPVSPSLAPLGAMSVRQALQQGGKVDTAVALAGWTKYAVGLGFKDGDEAYISRFGPRDVVSVQIVFLYPCLIPIGREFVCDSYGKLSQNARALIEVNGTYIGWSRFLNWRFVALSATASLPNQGKR